MNRPAVTLQSPWRFPTPEITQLDNGLQVWLFRMPNQKLVTFDLVLPVALTAEPGAREGVATVALNAIDEGTHAHPDGGITELLEAHGAALHGVARHRYTTLGGHCSSRRLSDVLPLFVEVLSQPEYSDRDIAHHVESQIADHASKLASPGASNRMALRRAMFGDEHRFGRPAAGEPPTLSALTPDDARSWHAGAYHPEGATFVIAGAVPDGALDALNNWRPEAPAAASAPGLPPRPASTVVVVDHPDSVQATIALATRTVTRDDPRWAELKLAGHVIAGAFASRLNLELRERLGYTYGVDGGFAAGVEEGQFLVATSVRTDVVGDALARLRAGLALDEPISETEADDVRRYLVGIAPLANETSADIVAQASALAAAGMHPDYLERHFDELAHVTAHEATDAYRGTITPEGLTVAISGDASAIVPAVEALGLDAEVVELA